MPHVTLQISPLGPVLDIRIRVSEAREKALIAAQQPVPQSIQIRGLIDTGASSTCVDAQILQSLGLSPTGTVPIHTPSTGSTPHVCNQYDVTLILVHPQLSLHLDTIAVTESNLSPHGIQALIGRDILAECLFIYDGKSGNFSLAF